MKKTKIIIKFVPGKDAAVKTSGRSMDILVLLAQATVAILQNLYRKDSTKCFEDFVSAYCQCVAEKARVQFLK